MFTLAITGERSLQVADKEVIAYATEQIDNILDRAIAKYGDDLRGMTGMAEGADALFAARLIAKNVKFTAAVPNKGYGSYYWGRNSVTGKARFKKFMEYLEAADQVVYVMEDAHNTNDLYLKGVHSNFIRNQYMVDNADYFLVYNPESRGTSDCLKRIKASNKGFKLLELGAKKEEK